MLNLATVLERIQLADPLMVPLVHCMIRPRFLNVMPCELSPENKECETWTPSRIHETLGAADLRKQPCGLLSQLLKRLHLAGRVPR